MNKEEINTISEEQVLHNKLSFEINQELIHLMKRIIEIQQENKALKGRIEYLERSCERKDESNIELYSENVDLAIAIGVSTDALGEGLRNGLLKIIEKMERGGINE